ncbi:hypothetical protein E3N88_41888 [Mikania micrantha]|uniref:glutathione transferase n=1 Tax=Mikania micrantha TaxID=192012 RepID=A0A5N6LJB7_9ASTR|nr:hypothetical protein E3N88_41888 [Mikania micrantha]
MADEVKLYGVAGSPFVCRVSIALNLKEIKHEFVVEDLSNKSADLIKYNPVHKKVPVFVHNGNPISESLVIIEYIDETWKGVPILPQDDYERLGLDFGRNSLTIRQEFFGGDSINLVDISAVFIAFWLGAAEEALGIKILAKDKFPKLTEWADNCINCQAVKDCLPPRENIVAFLRVGLARHDSVRRL